MRNKNESNAELEIRNVDSISHSSDTASRRKKLLTVIVATLAAATAVVAAIWLVRFVEKPAAPLEKLAVSATRNPMSVSVWVAEAKGFFLQEGMEVTLSAFDFGKPALAAMLNGESNVATVAATPIVMASFARRDFVVFATMVYNDNDVKIIARRDRGISKPADLNGKTIGTAKGSTAEYFLDAFIAHYALSRNTMMVNDIPPAEMLDRLERGEVDAIAIFEPYALQAHKRLGNRAVLITAPEVYRETFNLTARREFVRAHPQVLVKFLRAIVRAEDYIRAHPAEAQEIMARRSGLSAEDIASIWADIEFNLSLPQFILPALEDEARWAISSGLVKDRTVPNYLEFIHPDAMKAVKPAGMTIWSLDSRP